MKNIKHILLITLFSLWITKAFSQSLSADRILKIKSATVKIILDNQVIGTGFYINDSGLLITCWHVVESTIVISSDGKIALKPLFIENSNGQKDSVGIATSMFEKLYSEAVAYDFCLLMHKNPLFKFEKTPFLKLGSFSNVQEGDEVYTCGYPLGIPQPFISKGIVSTKYVERDNSITDAKGIKTILPRSQALLDMTLNKGNSGGAIVKVGKSNDEDEVIGVADFIINPIGGQGDNLIKLFNSRCGGVQLSGIDPNAMFSLLTTYINSSSNGISGCVSIDHFIQAANKK